MNKECIRTLHFNILRSESLHTRRGLEIYSVELLPTGKQDQLSALVLLKQKNSQQKLIHVFRVRVSFPPGLLARPEPRPLLRAEVEGPEAPAPHRRRRLRQTPRPGTLSKRSPFAIRILVTSM